MVRESKTHSFLESIKKANRTKRFTSSGETVPKI